MQPVVKASVNCARFDSISEECAEVGVRRNEHEVLGRGPLENVVVRRVVQADVSDMHRLVTRLAQELGEHRRQRVVDEQLH